MLLGTTYSSPSENIGDLRLDADVRLYGDYKHPFTLADGRGPSDAGDDGTIQRTRGDAGSTAQNDSGEESPTDSGFMEGGGCSCSTAVGGSTGPTGPTGWTLLVLGLAVPAIRRKRG